MRKNEINDKENRKRLNNIMSILFTQLCLPFGFWWLVVNDVKLCMRCRASVFPSILQSHLMWCWWLPYCQATSERLFITLYRRWLIDIIHHRSKMWCLMSWKICFSTAFSMYLHHFSTFFFLSIERPFFVFVKLFWNDRGITICDKYWFQWNELDLQISQSEWTDK